MSEYKTVYGKALKDMTLEEIYLDWRNEFASFEAFGEYYGISTKDAKELICAIKNTIENNNVWKYI